jgi:tetrapyrrole methylase family protein/MazG family protein
VIFIVGLGPGDPKLLTREAWDVLSNAETVFLRTRNHPTVKGLPKHLKLRSFDSLYRQSQNFEQVYAKIAEKIIAAAMVNRQSSIVYAVPGHPLVGEASVPLILKAASEARIPTRIVSGISFVESVLETLQTSAAVSHAASFDPLDGLQICDALELASMHHPPLNPDKPALVAQIYSRAVASNVKLTLLNQYSPTHDVFVVHGARTSNSSHLPIPLAQLDHADNFNPLTTIYLPPTKNATGFETLQETIAHLRAPEGCPWDREQTHASLRNTLLEETYEVLTAIDEDDMDALKEELGDLLLNVVLQAQIATEAEEFRMSDVIAEVNAKLIRRHPHVFGDVNANTAEKVVANWNEIKKQEKAAKGKTESSALDGIAPALPALAQAQKLAHRAERAGFRWKTHADRLRKVREELDETIRARTKTHRQEELGDLIFTIADWADGYGIDIETASREANLKFSRRFRALEKFCVEHNLDMKQMTAEALLAAWKSVKVSLKRK